MSNEVQDDIRALCDRVERLEKYYKSMAIVINETRDMAGKADARAVQTQRDERKHSAELISNLSAMSERIGRLARVLSVIRERTSGLKFEE